MDAELDHTRLFVNSPKENESDFMIFELTRAVLIDEPLVPILERCLASASVENVPLLSRFAVHVMIVYDESPSDNLTR